MNIHVFKLLWLKFTEVQPNKIIRLRIYRKFPSEIVILIESFVVPHSPRSSVDIFWCSVRRYFSEDQFNTHVLRQSRFPGYHVLWYRVFGKLMEMGIFELGLWLERPGFVIVMEGRIQNYRHQSRSDHQLQWSFWRSHS